MPDPTDFVTNLPADFETFGDAVDATVQTVKNTADAAIPKTLIDAKGDLIVGTAADTVGRLAVGTNGFVLTADSAETTGLKWQAAAGGSDVKLIEKGSNVWARPAANLSTNQNTFPVEDQTYYLPIYLPNCTLNRIAVRSGSDSAAGNFVRLGIYNNGANNLPTTVLLDAGTIEFNATSTNFEITINQSISAGWHWLAVNNQTVTSANRLVGFSARPLDLPFNATLDETQFGISAYSQTGVTGAFATAGSLSRIVTTTNVPLVFVRIA